MTEYDEYDDVLAREVGAGRADLWREVTTKLYGPKAFSAGGLIEIGVSGSARRRYRIVAVGGDWLEVVPE